MKPWYIAVLIPVHIHCYFDIHSHICNSCVGGNDVRDIPTKFGQWHKTIIPLTVTFQLVCWLLTSGYFGCGRCCDWWISSLGYMSGWRRINRFHMDQRTHLQTDFMSPVAPLRKQLSVKLVLLLQVTFLSVHFKFSYNVFSTNALVLFVLLIHVSCVYCLMWIYCN